MFSDKNISNKYIRIFALLFFYCNVFFLNAQLSLTFDGIFPGSQKWEGDVANFKNAQSLLQLNATVAGESSIFTKFKTPKDSIEYDLYFKMDFAPSAANMSKIYLFLDKPTEKDANGYFLQLGENGSNDAIQLWEIKNGSPTLLGSGSMGAIANQPAQAKVKFKIYRDGLWLMSADYEGGNFLEEDLDVVIKNFVLPDSAYFGIFCRYTATRVNSFFYDNIVIKTLDKDTTAPSILKVDVLSENKIKLFFDEALDRNKVSDVKNYNVNQNIGNPKSVEFDQKTPNEVTLIFDNNIISGKIYTININNVSDKSGNAKVQSMDFTYNSVPEKGELVISEVLTDPVSGGEDFIELYNTSSKFLKLDSLIIRNDQNKQESMVLTNVVLKPGEYVAFSANIEFLKKQYITPDSARLLMSTLPALNVSNAIINVLSQKNGVKQSLDVFNYDEKMHFALLTNTKGVSLEKINLTGAADNQNNWHSASQQTNYGTPGYKNSNTVTQTSITEDIVTVDKKIFTPNGDGFEDFIIISYELDKPGYVGTIQIYDTDGFHVFDLATNVLLGTEGTLKWDGVNHESRIVKTGMYILNGRFFHPDGEVKTFKKVVVAADKF